MKITRGFAVAACTCMAVSCVGFVSLGTAAEKTDKAIPNEAREGSQVGTDRQAEREVRDMERQWRQAWLAGDGDALDKIHADDFLSVPNIGIVSTKAEVMADVRRGAFRYSRMEQSEMTVRIYGTTAVVLGRTTNEGYRGDRNVGGDFRYVRIYVKRNGRWQAV